MACHKPIALKNPRSTKDYIYIDDLAAAILAVIENQYAGPINLGTGAGVTVLQIAQTIGQIMGCTHLLNLDQAASSPAEDPFGFVVADATRLRSLGWKPAISLTEGLTRLVKRLTPTPSLPQ
jgi:nucleoside-diphosphate-sugar epimerase